MSQKKKHTKANHLDPSMAAIEDLRKLLYLSDDAANRLKLDIPSDRFPLAYKVSRSIRKLRQELEQLRQAMGDDEFEIDFNAIAKDLISSSDRL
ncbi:MAG: hypothetical protein PVJ63_05820 [Thioalkalispiraceae bacterium]